MTRFLLTGFLLISFYCAAYAQSTPTGKASDFKVKTCLHSIGYAGIWRGQAQLTVDEFLVKAKELGFDGVMLMATTWFSRLLRLP